MKIFVNSLVIVLAALSIALSVVANTFQLAYLNPDFSLAICGTSVLAIGVFFSFIPRHAQRTFLHDSILSRATPFLDRAVLASTRLRHTSISWVIGGLLLVYFALFR